MRDKYFADKRDLVKWGMLLLLADMNHAHSILQMAYYRPESGRSPEIDLGGELHALPNAVLDQFRKLQSVTAIRSSADVFVMMDEWNDRDAYHKEVLRRIHALPSPSVVFLDPDTGLEPNGTAGPKHVREEELRRVWRALRPHDLLVFYQHQPNRNGQPWIDEKRTQFENALGVEPGTAKVAQGREIAHDVAFFYLAAT